MARMTKSEREAVKAVASKINAHLRRCERDPKINEKVRGDLRRFYNASAHYHRGKVCVCYVSYQGVSKLTPAEARVYLAHLDSGGTRRHFMVLHDTGLRS